MRLFAQDPTSEDLHQLAARGMSEAGGPKPLLLRVLTDLFVMRPVHTREESRQFAEIAHRLIADATAAECDHAAHVLCRHPAAPPDLLDRLAQRGGAGALELFGRCRALSTPILQEAAAFGDAAVAKALAGRDDLDANMIAALAARADADLAQALAARLPHRAETLALFLMADAPQRHAMIARARESAGETSALSTALEHGADTALRRLEATAVEGAQEEFAAALAEACRCDLSLACALIADPGGEPLTIALRALGLRPELATRLVLLSDPHLSHAQGRASALARLASGLSQDVAKRILDAIAGRVAPTLRHATLHDQTARLSSARPGVAPTRVMRSVADLLKRPA